MDGVCTDYQSIAIKDFLTSPGNNFRGAVTEELIGFAISINKVLDWIVLPTFPNPIWVVIFQYDHSGVSISWHDPIQFLYFQHARQDYRDC